jgi:outer membrane biosynthesis protein TonB
VQLNDTKINNFYISLLIRKISYNKQLTRLRMASSFGNDKAQQLRQDFLNRVSQGYEKETGRPYSSEARESAGRDADAGISAAKNNLANKSAAEIKRMRAEATAKMKAEKAAKSRAQPGPKPAPKSTPKPAPKSTPKPAPKSTPKPAPKKK